MISVIEQEISNKGKTEMNPTYKYRGEKLWNALYRIRTTCVRLETIKKKFRSILEESLLNCDPRVIQKENGDIILQEGSNRLVFYGSEGGPKTTDSHTISKARFVSGPVPMTEFEIKFHQFGNHITFL